MGRFPTPRVLYTLISKASQFWHPLAEEGFNEYLQAKCSCKLRDIRFGFLGTIWSVVNERNTTLHENVKTNDNQKKVLCLDTMTRYPKRRNVKKPTRIAIQGIWVLEAKLDILREHIVAGLRVVIGYPLISKSPSNYLTAYSLHSFPPANAFSASPSTLNPTHSDILFAPNAS